MLVTLFCWKSGWSAKKMIDLRSSSCRMNGESRAYQRSAIRPASAVAVDSAG
jgi:hypothetical protein